MNSSIATLDLLENLLYQGKSREALENFEQLKKIGEIVRAAPFETQILEILIITELTEYKSGLEPTERLINETLQSGDQISAFDVILLRIKLFLELGELNKCLELIKTAEELLHAFEANLIKNVRRKESNLNYIKGSVFRRKADYDIALDFTRKALIIKKESDNSYEIAECLNLMGVIHNMKGEFQSGNKYFQEALTIFNELDNKKLIFKIYNNLGINHWRIGDLSRALDFFHRSLSLSEELENPAGIAVSFLNIGLIYRDQGELNLALRSLRKSLGIFKELGQKYSLGMCLNNIGLVFHARGELKQALQYYQESLILMQEVGDKHSIAICHNNIGEVFQSMGEYNEALEHIKRSFSLFQEIGNNLDISLPLFNLIDLSIYSESPQETQAYLQQLQEINAKEEHKLISQRYRMAKALTLKNSKRARMKIKSSEILEKIIEEEIIDHGVTVLAMLELSELLIDELRAYGEEKIFHEVKELIQRLNELAKKQHSHSLVIDALILRAKLSMVEGDLNASQEYLERAEILVKEKGIQRLADKILKEKNHLKSQYEKWEYLIQSNAPFGSRLEQAQLSEYIKIAKARRNQWGL